MRYSDLGEARILKPAKRPVQSQPSQGDFQNLEKEKNWVSLGDALVNYLQDGAAHHIDRPMGKLA